VKHTTDHEALQGLADLLVEQLLDASNQELLDAVREIHGHENKLADEADEIFERALKAVELKKVPVEQQPFADVIALPHLRKPDPRYRSLGHIMHSAKTILKQPSMLWQTGLVSATAASILRSPRFCVIGPASAFAIVLLLIIRTQPSYAYGGASSVSLSPDLARITLMMRHVP